jgi:hypothetical protein
MAPNFEQMIKFLLEKQVIFIDEMEYLIAFNFTEDQCSRTYEKVLTLFVDCNDILNYASYSNPQISSFDDLINLYDFCYKEPSWGVTKWYCKKMQKQPLPQLKKLMIEEKVWEPWLEELQKHPAAE